MLRVGHVAVEDAANQLGCAGGVTFVEGWGGLLERLSLARVQIGLENPPHELRGGEGVHVSLLAATQGLPYNGVAGWRAAIPAPCGLAVTRQVAAPRFG